ncbi:glycosyl hydrolase family 18 protein [Bacillus sp. DNRA2]|uniref:glycosyl hydrolase family 18 protein n=1 Tax=Bacillus sp. DNRA2 TaxID=2723053 RepID=UPI0032B72003
MKNQSYNGPIITDLSQRISLLYCLNKEAILLARVQLHKQKSIPSGILIAGIFFGVLLVISSILIFLYPFASKDKVQYFKGEHPIVFAGKQQGNAFVDGESIYIPYQLLKKMDDSVIYDKKSKSMIITTSDKVVQMPTESLTFFVNQTPVNLEIPALTQKNGEHFIAIDSIMEFYPLRYKILPNTNAVLIEMDGQKLKKAKITSKDVNEEKLRLRQEPNLRSAYTAQTITNESVFIESKKEDYYFVRKENGIAGYIDKKLVTPGKEETVTVKQEVKQADLPEISGSIHLTWEAVYSKNPNTASIPDMPGVNVVSPTWFKLGGTDGTVHNLASTDYVKWAKGRGYQVWGLFSNAFDPDLTHTAFSDFETRQNVIRQLLHFSQIYDLDGFNIDIENVRNEDGPLVTQFVREATPYFHEAGLYVSMDITFISSSGNWSGFYEREKLADIVDYMVVMAYDEHWGSSPEAGSVASLPWVENNLQSLLKQVQNHKLVLGVPLYTRLWKETLGEDGAPVVTSEAMSMEKMTKWLTEHQLTPTYDAQSGQNYVEYVSVEENATYKVWLEDEVSLKKRAELAAKYELAGVASWSRYFAAPEAWSALQMPSSQVSN